MRVEGAKVYVSTNDIYSSSMATSLARKVVRNTTKYRETKGVASLSKTCIADHLYAHIETKIYRIVDFAFFFSFVINVMRRDYC